MHAPTLTEFLLLALCLVPVVLCRRFNQKTRAMVVDRCNDDELSSINQIGLLTCGGFIMLAISIITSVDIARPLQFGGGICAAIGMVLQISYNKYLVHRRPKV